MAQPPPPALHAFFAFRQCFSATRAIIAAIHGAPLDAISGNMLPAMLICPPPFIDIRAFTGFSRYATCHESRYYACRLPAPRAFRYMPPPFRWRYFGVSPSYFDLPPLRLLLMRLLHHAAISFFDAFFVEVGFTIILPSCLRY